MACPHNSAAMAVNFSLSSEIKIVAYIFQTRMECQTVLKCVGD
jgi:hypothetical protein